MQFEKDLAPASKVWADPVGKCTQKTPTYTYVGSNGVIVSPTTELAMGVLAVSHTIEQLDYQSNSITMAHTKSDCVKEEKLGIHTWVIAQHRYQHHPHTPNLHTKQQDVLGEWTYQTCSKLHYSGQL